MQGVHIPAVLCLNLRDIISSKTPACYNAAGTYSTGVATLRPPQLSDLSWIYIVNPIYSDTTEGYEEDGTLLLTETRWGDAM